VALDKQRIIEEAVALLDERGLDGVTMRNLAVRLDVQAPTLYWHVRNKAALIDELADWRHPRRRVHPCNGHLPPQDLLSRVDWLYRDPDQHEERQIAAR
jgi:AcrR family transcriptional regulator